MTDRRYDIDQNPELTAELTRRLRRARTDAERAAAFTLLMGYGWYDASGEWVPYLQASAKQHADRVRAIQVRLQAARMEEAGLQADAE